MMSYPWAENRSKLERALGELGHDAPEEAIKARYVAMAGRVLSVTGEAAPVEETPEPVEEKPKKAKKK